MSARKPTGRWAHSPAAAARRIYRWPLPSKTNVSKPLGGLAWPCASAAMPTPTLRRLRADHLRGDQTSRQLVAVTALLCRDFALAWRMHAEAVTS